MFERESRVYQTTLSRTHTNSNPKNVDTHRVENNHVQPISKRATHTHPKYIEFSYTVSLIKIKNTVLNPMTNIRKVISW